MFTMWNYGGNDRLYQLFKKEWWCISNMKHETAISRLKEQEKAIIIKSQIRGFTVSITDHKNNTGAIAIWVLSADGTATAIETLDIKGVASFCNRQAKMDELWQTKFPT